MALRDRDTPLPPSPSDPCPIQQTDGGAAAGPAPSRNPAARLIPTPFGLEAHGGNTAVSVFTLDGARVMRLSVNGQVVDLICGDDARDALVGFMARTPR